MSERCEDKTRERDRVSPLRALADREFTRREFLKFAAMAGVTVGVAGGVGGLLAACGGSQSTTTSAGGAPSTMGATTGSSAGPTTTAAGRLGGTLKYGLAGGDPAFIDPFNVQEAQGIEVAQALFDGLVSFDWVTGELKPAVAESWVANVDASVWTFHLKKGTRFSNGREVVADDFVYAWNRVANPVNKSDVSYHLLPVKGFDELQAGTAKTLAGLVAKDPYTLEVSLSYPWSSFPYVPGHPALSPVPKEEVERDPKVFLDLPVGNGPFKMAEPWKHSQYIKLVANPDYYGDKPKLDGIDFLIFEDEQTAYREFQAGNLDFATIPAGHIKDALSQYGQSDVDGGLTAEPGKQVLLGPEWSNYFINLNTKDATLGKKEVREALSLAINRQVICDTIFEGTREPATGPVCKGIPGYQDNLWPFAEYDVDKAESTLAAAGFPKGQGLPELTLAYMNASSNERVMQLVQADFAKIGVKVRLDAHEPSEYVTNYLMIENGAFVKAEGQQLMQLGWGVDYPTIDNFTYPLFGSKSSDNKSLYSNSEVDKQIDQARATADLSAATALYQQILKTVGADTPMLLIFNYRHRSVASSRVHDLTYSPQTITDFQKVWLSQ